MTEKIKIWEELGRIQNLIEHRRGSLPLVLEDDFEGLDGNTQTQSAPQTTAATDSTPTQQTTTTPSKFQTIKEIIQSVDDKCNPGTKYNWNSVKVAYQKEKNPSTPMSSSKTNQALYKEWKNGWRPECNKSATQTQNSQTTTAATTTPASNAGGPTLGDSKDLQDFDI